MEMLLAAARSTASMSLSLILSFVCPALAQDRPTKPADADFRIAGKSPKEALKTFQVLAGFRLELVAQEPLVADPVDVAYDEDGRAYVVEMRDYPYPEIANAPHEQLLGRVALLEDTDGDGRYDRRHDFADQFGWPTSVACWKGGVFVTAAPDVWYLKDNDGDGRADERRRVFTGFGRYNVQAIMNNLRWGLDLKIYGAASGNGGDVVPGDGKDSKPIPLSGRDFAFSPATLQFEAISGGARFGNSFDDWGERFVCNIRNPVQHVVLPSRYLSRNPLLAVKSVIHDAAEAGDQLPVYRISPPEAWRMVRARQWVADHVNYPRSELLGAGYWTSSSGVTVYRGDAYPKEFRGNVFVGEVAGNLVHRQVLTPDGVTFSSKRADENAEFVSSTDNWFRPVNFANAPDGTLHILDMYRETIEHPWSIPDEIKRHLDLSSGNDRGRIYRLCPPDYRRRNQEKLSPFTNRQLVELLGHDNAWHRETAQRLLFERNDPTSVPALRKYFQDAAKPLGRLHSLWLLWGLQVLTEEDLLAALHDADPHLRRHGVEIASRGRLTSAVVHRLVEAAKDSDLGVRFQVAMVAGEIQPKPVAALAEISLQDSADPWLRYAILSSSYECAAELVDELVLKNPIGDRAGGSVVINELAAIVGGRNQTSELEKISRTVSQLSYANSDRELRFAIVSGLGRGLARSKRKVRDVLTSAGQATDWLDELFKSASKTSSDEEATTSARVQAIDMIGLGDIASTSSSLVELLQSRHPRDVQFAALAVLRKSDNDEIAIALVTSFRQSTGPLQNEIIEVLLGRNNWLPIFLEAVATDHIPASQVSIPQRARLGREKDPDLQRHIVELFGPKADEARSAVIGRFRKALSLSGNISRGQEVFRRDCATCHRLADQGRDVGPSLLTVRHRSPEEMLIHILDPNREVPPQFLTYQATLKDGRVTTGIILSETDSAITLARGDDVRETVLRQDLDELVCSGKSLMPEGFEQKLSLQDAADLIRLIQGK